MHRSLFNGELETVSLVAEVDCVHRILHMYKMKACHRYSSCYHAAEQWPRFKHLLPAEPSC